MSLQTDILQNAINETELRLKKDETMLMSLHQILQELMPLVDRIRVDLKDSTTRMPDVSKQLSSVTQATENATVEILNVLEAMTTTVTNAQGSLARAKKNYEARTALLPKVTGLINAQPDGELRVLWQEYTSVESNAAYIEHIDQALAQTSEQAMNIAMALQVQDITSQQIAGATHLIEQVEEQLRAALKQFESPEKVRQDMEATVADSTRRAENSAKPQLTFDSGAKYSKDTTRQQEADEITKQFLGQ